MLSNTLSGRFTSGRMQTRAMMAYK